MEGVEPPLTEPESAVLPLDDIPRCIQSRAAAAVAQESILRQMQLMRKSQFKLFLTIENPAIKDEQTDRDAGHP